MRTHRWLNLDSVVDPESHIPPLIGVGEYLFMVLGKVGWKKVDDLYEARSASEFPRAFQKLRGLLFLGRPEKPRFGPQIFCAAQRESQTEPLNGRTSLEGAVADPNPGVAEPKVAVGRSSKVAASAVLEPTIEEVGDAVTIGAAIGETNEDLVSPAG